jgi:hypothetical protein
MSKAKLIFSTNKRMDPGEDTFVYQQAQIQATTEQAFEWFAQTLPTHFTPAAESRYGYAGPSSLKYRNRKHKKYGHDNPMVYSGTMRAELLQGHPSTISKPMKTKSTTTLRFPYARAANLWMGTNPLNPQLNFHKQLTAFDNHDSAAFEEGVQKRMPVIFNELLAKDSDTLTETYEV